VELTPEERERIFEEERVRLEVQQELSRDKAATDAEANKGCAGCLAFVVGLFLLLLIGTSPAAAATAIVAGCIGLGLTAFGDFHNQFKNPKAARIVLGSVSGLVLALGIHGIVWTSSDEYKRQVEQNERRNRQIEETADQPPWVQKDIDDEYHRNGNTSRRR
jgi:phosphate/sulfate permease